jgi:hypothetical protein
MPTLPASLRRTVHLAILIAAAIFLGLHWTHLSADFPNQSPWQDWSKYTDEGWYGDAAIRHFQLGHWYVPGDFNPAAALPVWPILEGIVFLFTGVSLAAVRALTVAVFAATLVAAWFLVTKHTTRPRGFAASAAVLLLAVSPFCFGFTRLAILEPLLVLLTLLSLLVASQASPAPRSLRQNLPIILALGLLLPLMVLTKTTALFLVPSIAWMLFARTGYRISTTLRIGAPACLLAGLIWGGYFLAVVKPHYLLDYRYLFSANAYTGITRAKMFSVISTTINDGMWIGPLLYPCAGATAIFALLRPRRLLANPLIPSLILWAAGYMAFLAYHNNLQPRYYLVVAVPLTLLLPVVIDQLILPGFTRDYRRIATVAAAALIGVIAVPDARMTLHFVRHPEYTLLNAARDIRNYIEADHGKNPAHSELVLSISGSDLSLMTGLPSICDDFGTLELVDRVKLYKPGWYVAWNELDDDKMEAIEPLYYVERVAAYPAMDDPERNLLILYRLDPSNGVEPNPHAHKPIPRSLRTKVGQQPSTTQLVH